MPVERISTGVRGLDEILRGGLLPQRSYLVCGGPGTGKTILGLHFLKAGVETGEKVLLVTMEQPAESIKEDARRLGLDLQGVEVLDISPDAEFFARVQTYDLFLAADMERHPITAAIVEKVRGLKPRRVFVDPMTQFRYLSPDPYQYRRQVLSFLRFLTGEGATVMFTSEACPEAPDDDLKFLSDGVIELWYEREERSLRVLKFRGSSFLPGFHSMEIVPGGIEVYPNIVPPEGLLEIIGEVVPSGIPELDGMLGGGIERGTVTVIAGPPGVGKTTLGLRFLFEAAQRGEKSALYCFEEEVPLLLRRAEGVGMPLKGFLEEGLIRIMKVEPLRYSWARFSHLVRKDVLERGIALLMIDSVRGLRLSLKGKDLVARLHALAKSLQAQGLAVILLDESRKVVGDFEVTEAGLSYLADNILFLKYFEAKGKLRKAIGVLKRRVGNFDKALHEFEITEEGIKIGGPLVGFRGILTGEPILPDGL